MSEKELLAFEPCIDVASFLKNGRYPMDFACFKNADKAMRPDEAVSWLVISQAKGHKVIPSGQCDKPCPNAHRGCTGFDHSGGGCPGHRI